ncbi:hypothetical protein PCL1606_36950 [Pseudomonas chlororaphis]|uniref:Uncharacterized protein n=1 Tax=Pseudomonas chlororaphis TaxID=587753 RepID=A0A0D5Y2D9_9PSED|nr:hypothetical protein PCL1606_36950 [Pseudomonas chlororaphis]
MHPLMVFEGSPGGFEHGRDVLGQCPASSDRNRRQSFRVRPHRLRAPPSMAVATVNSVTMAPP